MSEEAKSLFRTVFADSFTCFRYKLIETNKLDDDFNIIDEDSRTNARRALRLNYRDGAINIRDKKDAEYYIEYMTRTNIYKYTDFSDLLIFMELGLWLGLGNVLYEYLEEKVNFEDTDEEDDGI